MKKIECEILGKKWTVRLLKRKKYIWNNGNDSVALTRHSKKQIDLSPIGRDRETVIHELVHAYLGEICTLSAKLDRDAFEEIVAELFSKRGDEILSKADEIIDRIP